jgi:ribosomal protein L11 methyltransferase
LGDAHNLDPDALEPGVTVKIYVPGDEDTESLRRQIIDALNRPDLSIPLSEPKFQKLEEADWANAWRDHYRPFRVGERLWIQPGWLDYSGHDADDVVLTLDPGMAFGTGTHQTTQLCLMALEKFITAGGRVLDVGTGSGILAIAAAKLGASEVAALDTDRQAVKAAVENAQINQVAAQIAVHQGTLASVSPRRHYWNLVLVNILAPVIIELFEQDHLLDFAATNGRIILSGIIEEQVAAIDRVVRAAGGEVIERMSMDDWAALVVARVIS